MRSALATCFAACASLLACGPASGTAETSGGESSSGVADSSEAEGSTGSPQCAPLQGAAIAGELRRGDDGMPDAGTDVQVAGDGLGTLFAAMTDTDEQDDDVRVTAFEPDGVPRWSLRYEGMAGLQDTAIDVVSDRTGNVYVLVREQISELVSEGFGTRAELTIVVLAIGPGGERRWRYARTFPAGSYDNPRIGAITIAGDGRIVIVDADAGGANSGPPALTELDHFGNELVQAELDAEAYEVRMLSLAAVGDDVVLAASPWPELWVARVAPGGALRWQAREDGGQLATAVAAGTDDDAFVLVGSGDAEAGDSRLSLVHYDAVGNATTHYERPLGAGGGYPAGVVIDCDGRAIVAAELQNGDERAAWVDAVAPDRTLLWSTVLTGTRPLAPRSLAMLGDGVLAVGGFDGAELGPWLARLEAP